MVCSHHHHQKIQELLEKENIILQKVFSLFCAAPAAATATKGRERAWIVMVMGSNMGRQDGKILHYNCPSEPIRNH